MNIIIAGSGDLIYFLAKRFIGKGYQVTLINSVAEEARRLVRRLDVTTIVGDGSAPKVLEEAGVRQADVLLAVAPRDEDNLITCQVAGRVFGVPRTVAIVSDPENERVFRTLGVSAVFSPTTMIGSLLEEQADFKDVIQLASVAEGYFTISEVVLQPESPAIGKQIQDIQLPTNALISCVIRDHDVLVADATITLAASDRLIMVGVPDTHDEILRVLCGAT